jgi:Skp family chaperone for outer membrane proteins
LSPEARADKYDELQKKHRDLDEEVADFQRAMRKAHEDAKKVDQKLEAFYRKEMMAFEQEIKSVIEETAKSEGWDLVLAKEAVIYAGPSTDKTGIIVKKLDEKEAKRTADKAAKNAVTKK